MKVPRLSKATFFLLVAATLSGTVWTLPSRFRGVIAEKRREASPLSSSVPFFLTHPLSSETRLLASRAIVAYAAAKPLRISDYFHRWRFDALKGPYPSNLEVRLDLGQVQNQSRFPQDLPGIRSARSFAHRMAGKCGSEPRNMPVNTGSTSIMSINSSPRARRLAFPWLFRLKPTLERSRSANSWRPRGEATIPARSHVGRWSRTAPICPRNRSGRIDSANSAHTSPWSKASSRFPSTAGLVEERTSNSHWPIFSTARRALAWTQVFADNVKSMLGTLEQIAGTISTAEWGLESPLGDKGTAQS